MPRRWHVHLHAGNATYMSSILARSCAWWRIRPNLPWLVDAAVCLMMDAVILGQYAHFTLRDRKLLGVSPDGVSGAGAGASRARDVGGV